MTKEELAEIIERDLPGWKLSENAKLPQEDDREVTVIVTDGSTKKAVVISSGRVVGSQG